MSSILVLSKMQKQNRSYLGHILNRDLRFIEGIVDGGGDLGRIPFPSRQRLILESV